MTSAAAATDQLHRALREAVLGMRLRPGEVVTERGLEERFGLSRTPARTALARLEAEGLVLRTRRGWTVTPVDLADLEQVADYRAVVEQAVLVRVAQRAPTGALEGLRAEVAADPGPAGADAAVLIGTDFHVRLAELSGNPHLARAVRDALTRQWRTRWLHVRTGQDRTRVREEHLRILDALLAGDTAAAADALAAHLGAADADLAAALEQHAPVLTLSGVLGPQHRERDTLAP